MTLEEEDREKYDLLGTVSDLGNKNIQCFFLERAKQLLTGGGMAGIVVPSSVLSNSDTMHVQTREILLKYFDFISIVELGSGTFGKTGTNTVVLFLRRKAQRPEPAVHYWNRVQDFFENWETEHKTFGGQYLDIDVVQRYCQHINIPFEDYQTLLDLTTLQELSNLERLSNLFQHELFKDYRNDFDADTEIVNLKKKKTFKDLDTQAQTQELNKRFLKYLQTIEQDKLYYFILADGQNKKVLLVKSPSDTKEQRQFLGYEWSGAKGNEGIKYNGGDTVYDIITPMFDPTNPQNVEKINYLIQQNYSPLTPEGGILIPENLQPYVTYTNLTDLLDFSRKDFNKGFSLTPKNMKPISTKWDYIKISDAFLEVRNGKSVEQSDDMGNFKVSRIESIAKGVFDSNATKWTKDDVKEEDFLQKGRYSF
jgi:type I restriction-modification system DNA methylase subunit